MIDFLLSSSNITVMEISRRKMLKTRTVLAALIYCPAPLLSNHKASLLREHSSVVWELFLFL